MQKNYEKYTFDDFLKDDFFLESIHSPTIETELFWNQLIIARKIDIDAFIRAKQFVLQLNENRESTSFIQERIPILWKRIENTNQQIKKKKLLIRYLSIAASITVILIMSLTLINNDNIFFSNSILTQNADIRDIPKMDISEDIQLLNAGNPIIIPGDSAIVDYSDNKNIKINNEIVEKKSLKTEYNQLVVPHGKRSSIILADGSKIWVNAGTRMIYPVAFAKDIREIYIDGEIYADIVSDKNHPFIVKTKEMDVRVLGTQINVMAYENENIQSVVLVRGAVEVNNKVGKKEKVILRPNQIFYSSNSDSYVKEVDVLNYTSWKNGYSLFHNEKLGIILDRLSRYYGVSIICEKEAYNLTCSGGLDLKDDIDRVLDGVCQSVSVKYEKENSSYKFSVNP